MNTGNLIPSTRRANKARRVRLRRWAAISIGYACLLGVLSLGVAEFFGADSLDPAVISKARGEISKSSATLVSLRTQAVGVRRQLDSIQEVSDQPDWSILLAAVAKRRGEEIILSGCELSRGGSAIVLRIEGTGLTNKAIAAFVLRLQEIPVIGQVKLLQTSRKQMLGKDAYTFQLTCSLKSAAGGTHD